MKLFDEFRRYLRASEVSAIEWVAGQEQSEALFGEICDSLNRGLGSLSDISVAAFGAELSDGARTAICLHTSKVVPAHNPQAVVVGLPRSGTTLLQGTLCELLGSSSPTGWELAVSNIERSASGLSTDRDLAVKEVEERYSALRAIAPEVLKAHPLGASELEECTPIFRATGRHYPWSTMAPRLQDLEGVLLCDFGAKRAHHEWGQVYTHLGHPPLIVKSPLHTGYLPSLISAAPSATLLNVRRSLPSVVSSYGHMVYHASRPFDPAFTMRQAGAAALRHLGAMVSAFAQARRLGTRTLTIDYDDLTAAPREAVLRALRDAGHCWEIQASCGRAVTREGKHRTSLPSPRSLPSLTDLGVSKSALTELYEVAPELSKL